MNFRTCLSLVYLYAAEKKNNLNICQKGWYTATSEYLMYVKSLSPSCARISRALSRFRFIDFQMVRKNACVIAYRCYVVILNTSDFSPLSSPIRPHRAIFHVFPANARPHAECLNSSSSDRRQKWETTLDLNSLSVKNWNYYYLLSGIY